MMSKAVKHIDILAITLSALHNYFDGPIEFSDLYLANFSDTVAKPFFPCGNSHLGFFFA